MCAILLKAHTSHNHFLSASGAFAVRRDITSKACIFTHCARSIKTVVSLLVQPFALRTREFTLSSIVHLFIQVADPKPPFGATLYVSGREDGFCRLIVRRSRFI